MASNVSFACGMQVASSTAQCSPSQPLVRSVIREMTVGEMSLACCHLYPHAQSRSGSALLPLPTCRMRALVEGNAATIASSRATKLPYHSKVCSSTRSAYRLSQ